MFQYTELASLLKQILIKKKQLKTVLYSQQQKQQQKQQQSSSSSSFSMKNIGMKYSNLSLILNNINKFEDIHEQILTKSNKNNNNNKQQNIITNKYLLYVLISQYLNMGVIKGGGKLKRIIMENSDVIQRNRGLLADKNNKSIVNVRIRRVQLDQMNIDKGYQQWKGKFIKNDQYRKNQLIPSMYNLTSQQYSQLTKNQTQFLNNPNIVIQSFSSSLPPYLLFHGLINQPNNNKRFDIIDACSSPGNKTLQLSQYLGNRGTVYAYQKNQKRYQLLCDNLRKYQVKNVKAVHGDFLLAQPSQFNNVKLILLDPSCSGSGMLTNFTRDSNSQLQPSSQLQQQQQQEYQQFIRTSYQNLSQRQKQRVLTLQKFQLQLLTHAAKFNPQRISYSTCSIYIQENQKVVKQFIRNNREKYRTKSVLDYDNLLVKGKQLKQYVCKGIGLGFRNCIRVDPRKKISDGFFVTIFTKK